VQGVFLLARLGTLDRVPRLYDSTNYRTSFGNTDCNSSNNINRKNDPIDKEITDWALCNNRHSWNVSVLLHTSSGGTSNND